MEYLVFYGRGFACSKALPIDAPIATEQNSTLSSKSSVTSVNKMELEDFSVFLNTDTLSRSEYGSISGQISIQVGDYFFPDKQWSDFPVIILGWWLGVMLGFSEESMHDFEFMDGPYKFEIHEASDTSWNLSFFETRKLKAEVLSAILSPEKVLRAITSTSNLLIREISLKGWEDEDISTLKERHQALTKRINANF